MTTATKALRAIPTYETSRYAFYIMRTGSSIVRKSDNKSVYFQTGDDTAQAIESADHCFALPEMYQGENAKVFNQWCSEYL